MRLAVLFPGQRSQHVGMGAELFDARPDLLGSRADRILGWSLADVCLRGPEDRLTSTEHAQPALFAVAYALWEEFGSKLANPPVAAAGHSLGEYTALAAAGVLDFSTALRLVARRGAAMAEAADAVPSGMVALIGVDETRAEEIASARRAEGGRLWVANLNAPGQVVLSGARADIAWMAEHARDMGVRRAIPLKVAGAFHSPIMAPASEQVAEAVEADTLKPAAFPVYANVTARPYEEDVATMLGRQIVEPVRFADTLRNIEADAFVHVGPGDVTAGMARRVRPDAAVYVVNDLESAGAVAEELA